MNVIEDVIRAEAVVARALAAIAELQLGVRHICAAAHGALMAEALRLLLVLLLALLIAHGVVEVRGLPALVALQFEEVFKLGPEENDEIQKRHNGHDGIVPSAGGNVAHNVEEEVEYVNIREPLHADGDDEHEEHARIGIEQGESHEHGEVDVIRAVNGNAVARDEADDARADDGEQHAAQVIRRKLGCAPLPLERRADPVVEIAGDEKIERTRALRDEDEGDEPPDLPMEKTRERVGEEAQKAAVREVGQKPQHHVADDNIEHQVGNAEIGVQDTEAVDRTVELVQNGIPHLIQKSQIQQFRTLWHSGGEKSSINFEQMTIPKRNEEQKCGKKRILSAFLTWIHLRSSSGGTSISSPTYLPFFFRWRTHSVKRYSIWPLTERKSSSAQAAIWS